VGVRALHVRGQGPALGRTYESFSEDPGLVTKMQTAINGFQGRRARDLADPDRTLATGKHYAGDGDTEYGTGSGSYPIDSTGS
jgi:beta-glucosidase